MKQKVINWLRAQWSLSIIDALTFGVLTGSTIVLMSAAFAENELLVGSFSAVAAVWQSGRFLQLAWQFRKARKTAEAAA